jgi:hypothetical protein
LRVIREGRKEKKEMIARGSFELMVLVVIVSTMSGCALTSGSDRQNLFNPPGIHASTDIKSDAVGAGQIPITQYYEALKKAQDKAKGANEISDFVDKGIGLTSAYCLRWFQRLDEAQRRLDLQEKDFNVVRQLGTVFLGIGKAIPNWVTGYGAVNTAYSGIAENFNEAILAGPTTAKIKSQVLDMLQQSETTLRRDASGLTFAQAYTRIELHADTCTYSTVRNMLDATLANTRATRDPKTGNITIENLHPATAAQIFDMKTITSRVAALKKDPTRLDEINKVLKAVGAPKSDFARFDDAANALDDAVRNVEPRDVPTWKIALGL